MPGEDGDGMAEAAEAARQAVLRHGLAYRDWAFQRAAYLIRGVLDGDVSDLDNLNKRHGLIYPSWFLDQLARVMILSNMCRGPNSESER
jgi:hypothetical protein